MTDFDLSNLRPWLDEHEAYANSISGHARAAGIARQMLALIAQARSELHPSADSTANYVPNKEIITGLGLLRAEADKLLDTRA
ncbi:MAG: hypothetical protein JWN94_3251 [Betaproteobacteria bacterium]|nr:hypothetical protein [Betaproteobacteria bacterium]